MHKKLITLLITMFAVNILIGGTSFAQEMPPSSKIVKPLNSLEFDPEEREIVDLIPLLEGKKLNEGLNQIYTHTDGSKISVKIIKGQIAGYVVTDKMGKIRPVFQKRKEGEGPEVRCWVCYENPDGSKDCFRIDCPKGAGSERYPK